MQPFDVVVSGAGPAGAAVSRRLTRMGWRIALVHRRAPRAPRFGETLAPEITPCLRDLGLFEEFLETRPLESPGTISAWGSPRIDCRDFLSNPHGCGWHVDRDAFDELLRANSGATIVDHPPEGRFHIDATGNTSGARDYAERTVAIVAELDAAGADLRTSIESVPQGWWYTAPIPGGKMMAMLFVDAAAYAREGVVLGDALEHAPLTQSRIAGARLSLARPAAAEASIRREIHGDNWLAVGDAAAAFDPLSGWGVGKALADSAVAASAADAWLRGDPSSLHAYAENVRESYRLHLAQRRVYYAMEQRWPGAPFWARTR